MSTNEMCWFYYALGFVFVVLMLCEWLLKLFFNGTDKRRRLRKLRALRKWRQEWENETWEFAVYESISRRVDLLVKGSHIVSGLTHTAEFNIGPRGFIEWGSNATDAMRKVARLAYHWLRKWRCGYVVFNT